MEDPTFQQNSHHLAERVYHGLQKEYVVVGKKHIWNWRLWLIIGVLAGIAAGIFFVATRSSL